MAHHRVSPWWEGDQGDPLEGDTAPPKASVWLVLRPGTSPHCRGRVSSGGLSERPGVPQTPPGPHPVALDLGAWKK